MHTKATHFPASQYFHVYCILSVLSHNVHMYMHVCKGGEPRVHCEDLAAGDNVKVELDPDMWKRMQQGHGEWNDRMAEVNI